MMLKIFITALIVLIPTLIMPKVIEEPTGRLLYAWGIALYISTLTIFICAICLVLGVGV